MLRKNNKRILQLFSAGYDSTYLAIQNIKKGYDVDFLMFKSCLLEPLSSVQESRLMYIKPYLLKLTSVKQSISFHTEEFVFPNKGGEIILTQAMSWLFLAYFYANRFEQEFDELHIAYVANDDALSYLEEIKVVWKNLWLMSNKEHIPEIKFPLIKMKKKYIIEDFYNEYPNLLYLCPFCESITKTGELCFNCPSCERVLKTLRQNYYWLENKLVGKIPEDEREIADVFFEFVFHHEEREKKHVIESVERLKEKVQNKAKSKKLLTSVVSTIENNCLKLEDSELFVKDSDPVPTEDGELSHSVLKNKKIDEAYKKHTDEVSEESPNKSSAIMNAIDSGF